MRFIRYRIQQRVKFLIIIQRLVINYQPALSVIKMFILCYLTSEFWNFSSGNLILGAKQLPFSCISLGFCDSTELTSLACLSFEIFPTVLTLSSQYVSVNSSLSSPCCCVSSSSLYSSWSCTVLYSSHAFYNDFSLTFTSCMSTVPSQLSMYFLICVILALTAARFLTIALRVSNPCC